MSLAERSSDGASSGGIVRWFALVGLFSVGVGAGVGLDRFWLQAPDEPVPTLSSRQSPGVRQDASVAVPTATANAEHPAAPPKTLTALADLAGITSEFAQSAALYELAQPLNAEGILALLQRVRIDLDGSDAVAAGSILVGRYAELDFPAALAFVLENGGDVRALWLRSIFHAQARIDLDDAVERAAQLAPNFRQLAGLAILRSNQGLGPAQRRSIAQSLGVPPQMVAVAQRDVGQAWQDALAIADPQQRNQTLAAVAMTWGRSDPIAALRGADEISSPTVRMALQGQLLGLAAQADPQAALDWLNAQPEGNFRRTMIMSLVPLLGAEQAEFADRLLVELPAADRRNVELTSWGQRVASDPEGAAAWAASRAKKTDKFFNSESQQLFMMLKLSAPESIDRFVNALPAAERARLEPTYVEHIATQDIEAAARRVETITDDQQRLASANSLLTKWIESDPGAAQRWVQSQPTNEAQVLYRNLGQRWYGRDADAARAFAQQIGSGSQRDQFNAGLAIRYAREPELAAEIVERISDAQIADRATKMLEQMEQITKMRNAVQGF